MATETQYLTLQAAAEALGTSRRRLWQMIRNGEFVVIPNPLDRREKLVARSEVERLSPFASRASVSSSVRTRARPRTFDMVDDPDLQSDEIEEYIQVHWRPE